MRTGDEFLKHFLENETWDTIGFQTLLHSTNEESFDLECQEWISRFASVSTEFGQIKAVCVSLLEESDFLNFYDDDIQLRNSYQERISLIAEYLSYYEDAKTLTLNEQEGNENGATKYINNLFAKLKKSGFVYHPRKHINTMMCLFMLNQELMEFSIEELFSIIFTRQIEIWKQDPFRTVMIRALDRYIQSTDDKLNSLAGNTSAIDNAIRALVVQLTLGGESDEKIFDRNLNTARLYRYATYKAVGKSRDMFSRAYEFLLGQTKFGVQWYSLYKSKSVDLIASFLNNEMKNREPEIVNARWKYENNDTCLLIEDGKITILPSETNSETRSVLPSGLFDWQNIEVKVNDKVEITPNNTDILPYKIMWEEIEGLLFTKHVSDETTKYIRRHLDEGDETMITIDKSVDSENNFFICSILDKNILGEAYIDLADIVNYIGHALPRNFCDTYGHKLKFMAKVDSIDEDGNYHMSLKDGIDTYIKESIYDGLEFSCSVGDSYLPDFGIQRGVSYEGFPLTVAVDEKLERNTRLTGSYIGFDKDYHAMQVSFINLEPAQKFFTPSEAFQRLMASYSSYCTAKEYERNRIEAQKQEVKIPIMSRSHVIELMLIIDRIAILQQDYLTSYNYLALARILARMLGIDDRRNYYNGRMDMIELLNYFAINNTVDEKKLAELENANGDMFRSNIFLHKRFNQVQLVSWLGKPEHNVELRETWENAGEDEIISDIAGLALSYNILIQAGLNAQASDVHNQIKNLLNLKGHESNLKSYGVMEDVTCEFKTSIVYVAGTTNKFDPETQMDNILKVVDEMLNTRGGIIYLGVNRYGQGVGLKNDLDNILFRGDKEEYIRFIYKNISNKISPHAANVLVHIDFDKENETHDICIIKIDQSPMGMPFKGEYCVRRGDSVYRYDKEGYEEYRKIRDSIYASDQEVKQTMLDEGLQAVSIKDETHVASIDTRVGEWDKVQASTFIEQIATSVINKEDKLDLTPLVYLNLMGNGRYQCTDTPMGNIPLSLPIYVTDEYVIIVYTDGTAACVPIGNIADKELNIEYHGVSPQRVAFACTASKNDSLLLIVNTKNGGVMRVQDIDRLQRTDMLGIGKRVVNDEASNVECCELVSDPIRGQFKKCRNIDCGIESKHGKKNLEKLVDLGVL